MKITQTVNELVYRAFKLIGLAQPDRAISHAQLADGLYLLNTLLDSFSAASVMIPFRQAITFSLSPSVADYAFGDSPSRVVTGGERIIGVEAVTLWDQDSPYSISVIDFDRSEREKRWQAFQARPCCVRMQRAVDYTTLTFMPTPDKAYPITAWVKTPLAHVSERDVLDQVPSYYHRFLRFALARELSCEYQSSGWSNKQETTYLAMKKTIESASNMTIRVQSDNPFMGRGG